MVLSIGIAVWISTTTHYQQAEFIPATNPGQKRICVVASEHPDAKFFLIYGQDSMPVGWTPPVQDMVMAGVYDHTDLNRCSCAIGRKKMGESIKNLKECDYLKGRP